MILQPEHEETQQRKVCRSNRMGTMEGHMESGIPERMAPPP